VARRLIVNIRGSNAVGKTTLARMFLPEKTAGFDRLNEYFYTHEDGTKVAYSSAEIPGLKLPVIVLGTYDASKYSGMDKVKSADAICGAVEHAAKTHGEHHTLFEGFRVSKSWDRYAELRNRLVREADVTWLWAMLNAPLELIYARSEARRDASSRPMDEKELAAVWRVMNNSRVKAKTAFPDDTVVLDAAQKPEALFALLVLAMRHREQAA
jgi:hypothetical protein